MESQDYLELSTTQLLKKKFKEFKDVLKGNLSVTLDDFTAYVIEHEPVYNSIEGLKKIQNAWYGKHPDLRLTELIEEYKTELI